MKSLEELLKMTQTEELVRSSVRTKLLHDFPDESLESANAAVGVVFDSVLDDVLGEIGTWAPTRANYVDAVKTIAARCLVKARHSLANMPSHVLPPRDLSRDDSIW